MVVVLIVVFMVSILKFQPRTYANQAIRTIYGINHPTAIKIMGLLRLHPNALFIHLQRFAKQKRFNDLIEEMKLDFDKKREKFKCIFKLLKTYTYRGLRHAQGLPCRGQRTHTNAGTPRRLYDSRINLPFKVRVRNKITISKSFKKKDKNTFIKKNSIKLKGKAKIKAKAKAKEKAKQKARAKKKL